MSFIRQITEGTALVFVREYLRFRLGKWEQVCSHYRGLPSR